MEPRPWKERLLFAAAGLLLFGGWFTQCGHRPSMLPLSTSVDGPSPSRAAKVLLMLHGHGGSSGTTDWIIGELRKRGVGPDVSVVMVDGPFRAMLHRGWGVKGEESDESLSRVRALISGWKSANPNLRVYVAGFSRGADVALHVAANEPMVSGVCPFASCEPEDVPLLAQRQDLAVTVVHATNDQLCAFASGISLVNTLRAAGHEVTFVEHNENHSIPPAGLDALAKMLAD